MMDKDQLLTLVYFLKGAKDENIYFGGFNSKQAWEALAQISFKMSGDQLDDLLNKEMENENDNL